MPNTNDTQPTNERTRAQVTTARTVAEAARKTGEKVQSRIIIVENLADTSLVIDQAGDPNTVVEPSAEALSAAALSPIMQRLAALEATPTPAATVAEQVQTSARLNRLADHAGITTRAIGIGWEDTSNAARRNWSEIARAAVTRGYNTIDLAAGRPEWTLFQWPAHPEWVSLEPQENHLRDVIATLRANGIEKIYLTLDMMVSTSLAKFPEWKAISRDGTIRNMPSPAALTRSPIRDMLAGAVAQVAAQFGDIIDGIIITELFWDSGSFSDNDLLLYRSDTGATDWPRSEDGALQETPEYREWLTTKMADFIAHCRSLTAGVPLVMDVRVNWNQPLAGRPDSGHDYAKLLRVADEIQPWVYYDTGEESKAIVLVYVLNKQWPGRVRPALGLWSATPASVGKALAGLATAHRVQVTPYSKMGTLLR